jgi:hypothetical protein
MATKFNMTRDINGFNGYGLIPSDTNYSATLSASSDTSVTTPGAMGMGGNGIASKSLWIAVLNYTGGNDVWVAVNTAASAPGGSSFASTSSMLLPAAIQVNGGDVLHFYTTASSVSVSVRFYSIS